MSAVTPPPRDFAKARIRSRIEAWLLDASADRIHRQHGRRKKAAIGGLSGTVVEIGPGTGANMAYYPPGVKVIGIEPNPAMHDRLRAKAAENGVDLEIRTMRGEQIDVADGSADAVVATLVLCGVDDPDAVLAEVKRILKPGATFFFLEHVAAPAGTPIRRVQDVVMPAHRWMFNGCEVNRDTAATLRRAGFAQIDLDEVDAGPAGLHIRHQIVGTAIR